MKTFKITQLAFVLSLACTPLMVPQTANAHCQVPCGIYDDSARVQSMLEDAATITKAEPMATAFSAVRSGIVMFVIPFVFAMYPEILLIEAAVLDPTALRSAAEYLPGYDGTVHIGALVWLLFKLVFALYLLASALAGFDRKALSLFEIVLRLALAALIMFKLAIVYIPAIMAAVVLVVIHHYRTVAAQCPTRS